MEKKFKIDFFEFSFLVEACLPDVPIARSMLFQEVSDTYYHQMTPNERERLFNWIRGNGRFSLSKEECLHFYDRFNPDNQYRITTKFKDKEEIVEAYLHNMRYHTNKITSINEEFITNIEKI